MQRQGSRVVNHLKNAISISRRRSHAFALAPSSSNRDMQDEYGDMTQLGETATISCLTLENGQYLENIPVNFATYGQLNANRDNVLVVCHALTGNAKLDSWWPSFLGPSKPFDTDKYFIVCANVLGSCYGTLGPASINPDTGVRYGSLFPSVTVRDSVSLHLKLLTEHLDVRGIKCVVGGSLGGMQALEWLILNQEHEHSQIPIERAVIMACGAAHSPWQIATSECQRQAIYADPNWNDGNYSDHSMPLSGLAVARQMAMVSYRTPQAYNQKFGRRTSDSKNMFEVESYLEHQGKKFMERFDAGCYVSVTKMMDTHDVGRGECFTLNESHFIKHVGRGGIDEALSRIQQPVMVIGISSDLLYPLEEQHYLHDKLPNSVFHVIDSPHGHDGFLLEDQELSPLLESFIHA